MEYRKKIYSSYISSHTLYLYGEITIEKIKKQFPVWKKYFGNFLPFNKEVNILDIGCGEGGFVYFLQTLGYKNSEGIDISEEQVEKGVKLGIPNIKCADVNKFLKGKEEIYDIIFARDVIEHFKKDEILDILELIYKSLKQNGILVIKTPNAESPLGSRYRYWDFTHEISFTRSSLNQVLKSAGFREIEFYPAGPVPKGFRSTIRFLLWKIITFFIKFYLIIETGSGGGIFTQNIIAVAKK